MKPHFRHFIERSWKNFFLMLLLWYVGVIMYALTGSSNWTLAERLLFYTKFSWPNFALCYILAFFIIPESIKQKRIFLLIILTFLTLAGYIALRYFNNLFWVTKYYSVFFNGILRKLTLREIISGEAIRGFEFIFIAYAYRFIFNWVVAERQKRELETEKLKSDLTLLRYQLNPHFLFNTINDIYYLSIIKSEKTPDALLKLSDLLRYVLHEKEDFLPLDKEIEHLNKFIELHKFRFPDESIDMNTQIDTTAQSMQIPPMLLTTFIENAFKHGEPGTTANPVKIELTLSGNRLTYKVINQIGQNISKDKTSGIGQPNLQKRLNLIYPKRHFLRFEQQNEMYISELEILL